jgi:hypothetical protein
MGCKKKALLHSLSIPFLFKHFPALPAANTSSSHHFISHSLSLFLSTLSLTNPKCIEKIDMATKKRKREGGVTILDSQEDKRKRRGIREGYKVHHRGKTRGSSKKYKK